MELLSYIKEKYEQKYERTISFKTGVLNAKVKLHEIKSFLEFEQILISLDYSETRERGMHFLGSYNINENHVTIKGTIKFICTDRMLEYILKKYPELKYWRRDEIMRHDGSSLSSEYFALNDGLRIHNNGYLEMSTNFIPEF